MDAANRANVDVLPDFDGRTYRHTRDHVRLGKQAFRVWAVLLDGEWHTLSEIARKTNDPEASVSARIRDLRKPKFGGYDVERENLGAGTWRYRLLRSPEEIERLGPDGASGERSEANDHPHALRRGEGAVASPSPAFSQMTLDAA